ncbi:hypothetical protein M1583_02585 [Candidatus Marsarchaeota archaeon]|nr:hypothetical protein [Candidatus Marsarchaeota archaeon]
MATIKASSLRKFLGNPGLKYILIPILVLQVYLISMANGSSVIYATNTIGIVSELTYIKAILAQVGPILGALLFIVAGVFYALGQIMPPDKRANFHTAAINIIIGAIIISVLSVASTSLAVASSHLLANSVSTT